MEKSNVLKEINRLEIPPSGEDVIVKGKTYWPVLRGLLNFIKIFTFKEGDDKIDAIIAWGDELFEFQGK